MHSHFDNLLDERYMEPQADVIYIDIGPCIYHSIYCELKIATYLKTIMSNYLREIICRNHTIFFVKN